MTSAGFLTNGTPNTIQVLTVTTIAIPANSYISFKQDGTSTTNEGEITVLVR
jgi:hypothetical protein